MIEKKTEKKLVDHYPLNQIYFYLTDGCNLKCRHCWIAPTYQPHKNSSQCLSPECFRSIIEQAKPLGLSGVKLTGGEPLLHPEISEILNMIRMEKLQFTLETNGVLCTEKLAREMAACNNPFISVSLDGADAPTHEWVRGISGCFEAAKEGIRTLVSAGLRPQLIMTVMRRNRDQIEPMVRLAESLGADSVKFNILHPTARGERIHESGESLNIESLVAIGSRVENALAAGTDLTLYYDQPAAFRPLSKMFGQNGVGCNICSILGILGVLADGSYALCGIGETIPDLVFGHTAADSLEDIWHDTPVLQELRQGLPKRLEGICGDCMMNSLCLGSCIAQNYYGSRDLWAPFWFCEAAREQGLFPDTRLVSPRF